MILTSAEQNAAVNVELDPAHDSGPWTTIEMELLADEADEIMSRKEAHGS